MQWCEISNLGALETAFRTSFQNMLETLNCLTRSSSQQTKHKNVYKMEPSKYNQLL